MEIVIASRNKHKIGELAALLSQYIDGVTLLSLDDIGFEGDIEEDGTSFRENALIKARVAAGTGKIGVGEKIDDMEKFDADEFVKALFD